MTQPQPVGGPMVPEPSLRGSTRFAAARLLVVAGFTFAAVGFVDLILLWIPARFSSVAWEYATVGRTLDALPMPALGLVLIGYGVLKAPKPTRRGCTLVAVLFAGFGLLCAGLAFLLLTVAPAVISQSPDATRDVVTRAATRHVVQSLLYPLAWFAIAFLAGRAARQGGQ